MVYRHLRLKHFAVSPRVWIPQRRIRKSSPLDHLKAAATERQFEPVCRLQMMASDLASLLGQKCITLGFQQWIQVQYRPLTKNAANHWFAAFFMRSARSFARNRRTNFVDRAAAMHVNPFGFLGTSTPRISVHMDCDSHPLFPCSFTVFHSVLAPVNFDVLE